ncbi:MAG: hypothetical protein ACI9MC_001612 [Kiritimatiellia bacterium]|jgi:hypothetical protein
MDYKSQMDLLLDAIESDTDGIWSPALDQIGCTQHTPINLGFEVLSADEALSYTRILVALGRRDEAMDVLSSVVTQAQPASRVA